jgi:adenylate cyclase
MNKPATVTRTRLVLPPVAFIRLLIAAVAILLTVCSQWFTPMSSFTGDEWLRDQFIRIQASSQPESRLTVIDIDESSLATVGPWPWSRNRIAELLETLIGKYGAKGVALDLVLPEPADPDGDMRLSMIGRHGPVVLAQVFDYEPREPALQVGRIGNGASAHGLLDASTAVPVAYGYIGNHAGLSNAQFFGNIGFIPDKDGTVRHLPMLTSHDGKYYPTLSLALLECCNPRRSEGVRIRNYQRIPYARDWSAYTVIPAAAVLNGSAPLSQLANRLVIIGSSSLGLSDRVSTPLSPSTSGVLVHASQLSAMLDQQAGDGVAAWPGRAIATVFAILLALLATYTFPRFSALANVALLAGASLVWLFLAYYLSPRDQLLSPAGPFASALFLLAAGVPFDWQISQRKSLHLLGTLRQYVAKAVVDELLRRGLENPLAPQRLHVTTLIADMEGYTRQVESLSMEDAAQLTKDFLTCLTRPVLESNGTLDKYTGDGLVAFWGAPLPIDDHADLALDAAEKIEQEVRRFSAVREEQGFPPLRVRIGIESGVAMAGDFGTSSRSIYTAVGDSVNVASRLEQVARDYPYNIIIGHGTHELSRRHKLALLGNIVLRGKEKPTTLYTLESCLRSAAQPASEKRA